ncbi:MAG: hypothetical protein KAI74_04895 [Kiritimatiellae bacterium]|nr:hypothetical protein [Kiritimatiellia bacterium]
MKVELKGWKAVVVIIIVAVVVIFRYQSQTKELNTQGAKEVERWMFYDYARKALPAMQKAMADPKNNKEYLEKSAHNLTTAKFEVLSITRHGLGDEAVAKVTIKFKEGGSEKGTKTIYLKMTHSLVAGWRVTFETGKISYYLAAF